MRGLHWLLPLSALSARIVDVGHQQQFYYIAAGCALDESLTSSSWASSSWKGQAWGMRNPMAEDPSAPSAYFVETSAGSRNANPDDWPQSSAAEKIADPNFPAQDAQETIEETFHPGHASVLVAGSRGATWVAKLLAMRKWNGPILLLSPVLGPVRFMLDLVSRHSEDGQLDKVRFFILRGDEKHDMIGKKLLKDALSGWDIATYMAANVVETKTIENEGHSLRSLKENIEEMVPYLDSAKRMLSLQTSKVLKISDSKPAAWPCCSSIAGIVKRRTAQHKGECQEC